MFQSIMCFSSNACRVLWRALLPTDFQLQPHFLRRPVSIDESHADVRPIHGDKNSKLGCPSTKPDAKPPEDSTQLHCKFIVFLNAMNWAASNSRGTLGNYER